MIFTGLLLTLLPASVALTSATAPADVQPSVKAVYVVIGADSQGAPQPIARVIISDAETCPQLLSDGAPLEMALRPDPHGFEVGICEVVIPFDTELRVSWNGAPLPIAKRRPGRIALFGDTGCKHKECGDGPAQPFGVLANLVAALDPPPELILHAGDFNYRNTKGFGDGKNEVYDAGDVAPDDPRCQLDDPYVSQNAEGSSRRDSWEAWKNDVFDPASKLLAIAPLLSARGNHELCSRAGPGYFFFLDPLMGDNQIQCPPQGSASQPPDGAMSHIVFAPPAVVDLGAVRIAVVDSANACDGFAPAELKERYGAQLASVLSDRAGTPLWILTHRPFWAVTRDDDTTALQPVAVTLQQALANAAPRLPSTFQLALGGHMHQFLAITFEDRPAQLVVGNSGVETYLGTPDGEFEVTVGGTRGKAIGSSDHGFMDLRLDGDAWSGTVIGTDGKALVRCASAAETTCSQVPARRTTSKE